jgi:hypothetical protein
MLCLRIVRRKHIKLLLTSFLCISAGFSWLLYDTRPSVNVAPHDALTQHSAQVRHPLDDVIAEAQEVHEATISTKTTSMSAAVLAYKRRRGRHPPPGFDTWYTRALDDQAVIVESFFDPIYEDLEPFWGMKPDRIRNSLSDWEWTIRIRNGNVRDVPKGRFRSRVWGDMIQQIAVDLPDMDIAINPLDEPRVFVPWSKIDHLVKIASLQRERMMSLPENLMLARQAQPNVASRVQSTSHNWIKKGSLWPHILETCEPSRIAARPNRRITTHNTNWTISKDICANHHWAGQHGSLTKPATMDINTDLVPLFSSAKLYGSNDILLPPPSYYTDDTLFTGKGWFGDGKTSIPWRKKFHGLVWRGKATGGLLHDSTWRSSHRQRLVSMLNASDALSHWNDSLISGPDFGDLQTNHLSLVEWLSSKANAGFTDTLCSSKPTSKACQGMSDRFSTVRPIVMRKQYRWRYLPDIDGNSLSGRFRAFLRSNSSPMKVTIFKEWHDSRLMPWVHFIPLDITLRDLWYTMAYFLGFQGIQAHDSEGEQIATEGRLWAEKVLRKEDMLLYVHRVLLEYARLCDDDRDRLGFTDDLRVGRRNIGI